MDDVPAENLWVKIRGQIKVGNITVFAAAWLTRKK